ncbi:cytochrome c oxidase assembly protein [Herbiconiux liangxiaofengii]|uniref:cytochrome c oxidase assembly protein n=1 Tax=Herbiconiux liangxiaofengii TaxID=3342795 RepID=UPI0035B788F3
MGRPPTSSPARSAPEELPTPDIATALTTWRFDPVAALVIVIVASLYLAGVVRYDRARRGGRPAGAGVDGAAAFRGGAPAPARWPRRRVVGFLVLGLGSFAVIEFGFLGVYSGELRFAFSTRIALLLLVVPALLATGRPAELAAHTLRGRARALLEAAATSRLARLTGNAVFGTVLALAVFCCFLTPLAGWARTTPAVSDALDVLVPALGAAVVIPLAGGAAVSGLFLAAEFMLAFAELVLDAIPGIVLRLSDTVLDGVTSVVGGPAWFPSPLRDQQLSGDLLWFIAELADIPVLVFLFIRWSRHDRREARSLDDLSDADMAALTAAHLGRPAANPSPAAADPIRPTPEGRP